MMIEIGEIIRNLRENPSLNFIGVAVTLHQVNAIDVAIMKLNKEGKIINGFVLLAAHHKTGRLLKKSNFYSLKDNVSVYNFDMTFDKIKRPNPFLGRWTAFKSACSKEPKKRIVYIVLPNINWQWIYIIERNLQNSKVVFIIIDDGAGSYANTYKKQLQHYMYNHSNQLKVKSLLKVVGRVIFEKIFTHCMISTSRLIDNRIFINHKNRFIRNTLVTAYYDDLYKQIGHSISKNIVKKFESAVLINTQCLYENNIIDGYIDLDLYKRLIKSLRTKDIKVIIKTHPRELDIGKYDGIGCDVYSDREYSQESIIAGTTSRPICVVSLFSSTLLNLTGIFDIPAISLAKIMRNNKAISETFRGQLDDYIKQYDNIIIFPESIDEAVRMIYDFYEQGLKKT